MTRRDFDMLRRLEAVEFALGLPRRVPLLICDDCGFEIAYLRRPKPHATLTCPQCSVVALRFRRTVTWPPSARPWWSRDDEGDESVEAVSA